MKKRFSILTLIVVVFFAVLITFQTTYLTVVKSINSDVSNESFDSYEQLNAVDYVYRNYYFGDIDEEELERGLIYGYIYGTGDMYGEYMDAEMFEEFNSDSEGNEQGIGISVIYNNEYGVLEIVNVLTDSPAEQAGVEIGDLIVSIGTEDAQELGYYGSLAKLKGDEGTDAVFTVLRGEDYLDFSVTRSKITQVNVVGRMHADGITGIVRIEEFDNRTPEQFTDTIQDLLDKGAQRFVFDVRNNPGGELESIVDVLDYLLPEGPVIRIEDRDGNETSLESDAQCFDKPMAVLINENTASAAELFAAALKDYDAAELVGKTTYGKGTMQTVVPLINGSALRLTFRMYKPPFSDSYDGIGVVPDIDTDMAQSVIDKSLYKLSDKEDTQLIRAIDFLNNGN